MKKILKALIPLFLLVLPTNSFAHNILKLDVDSITNSDIFIRQVESHLEMWGTSSGNNFQIVGDNVSVNIDMQSTDSGCCNYVTGGFISNSNSSLKILMDGAGSDHVANFDYDYSGTSNYHHVDIDFGGAGHTNKLYLDDSGVDHSNTSYELDITGSGGSNTVYAKIGGTQQATKVDIDGGSNLVYTWTQGVGDLATGRTSLYESSDASTYTMWIKITGSSNTIRARSIDTAKTKITLSGTGNHTISQFTIANGYMYNGSGGIIDLTIAGSSNNRIGYSGDGNGNTAIIVLNASNQTGASVDLWQDGGGNRFELTVTGSSIHQYTPYWIQQGDETYCATVNLNTLSSSVSGAQSTGNDGGCS